MQHIEANEDAALCYEVLAITTITFRPVSVTELASLRELESLTAAELVEVISACGSFLTVRDNVVYFVYQSAEDYLVTLSPRPVFPYSAEQ